MSLEEYKRLNTRKASALVLGGFKPTGNPLATHFGLSPVARQGELWPLKDGKPLFFICQFNLTECPYVPDILKDIKLLTFFIAAREMLFFSRSEAGNGARGLSKQQGVTCVTGSCM